MYPRQVRPHNLSVRITFVICVRYGDRATRFGALFAPSARQGGMQYIEWTRTARYCCLQLTLP